MRCAGNRVEVIEPLVMRRGHLNEIPGTTRITPDSRKEGKECPGRVPSVSARPQLLAACVDSLDGLAVTQGGPLAQVGGWG
jgi:hypothetical protein